MKRLPLVAGLLLIVSLSGCVKYRVSLSNGDSFTVLGKPKLDKENGVYRYKAGGKEQVIPASRVNSIVPDSDKPENKFQSSGR